MSDEKLNPEKLKLNQLKLELEQFKKVIADIKNIISNQEKKYKYLTYRNKQLTGELIQLQHQIEVLKTKYDSRK